MKKFDWYSYAADKKDLRKVLQGIYCNKGLFVVSDSHLMIGKMSRYPEVYEGKIVLQDGSFVEGEYPKYKYVLSGFKGKILSGVQVQLSIKKWVDILKSRENNDKFFVKLGDACFNKKLLRKILEFCEFAGIDHIVTNGHGPAGYWDEDKFCLLMPTVLSDESEANGNIIVL